MRSVRIWSFSGIRSFSGPSFPAWSICPYSVRIDVSISQNPNGIELINLVRPSVISKTFISNLTYGRTFKPMHFKSNYWRCLVKKVFVKISQHLCQGLFFNKVASLRPATLLVRVSGADIFFLIF